MMTLQEQLNGIKAKAAPMITPEVAAAMKLSFDELKNDKVLEKALKVGDRAPAFVLPNGQGNLIHSDALLRKGPLIILFYRGRW